MTTLGLTGGERRAGPNAPAWRDLVWRVWGEVGRDRISLIAAGASFYLLLSLFPALAAFVSLYGFVADPITIADHIAFLGGLLPAGGFAIIRDQLEFLAGRKPESLSVAFLIGLATALWSANSGIRTLFEALNIAYGAKETRGFFRLTFLSLAFTLAAMGLGALMIISVGVVSTVLGLVRLGTYSELIVAWLRWPLLLVAIVTAISILYRFGPDRPNARFRWLSWGSGLATLGWLAASAGYSWYLQNIANYGATYGSLGAVVGLMLWIWISASVVLVGAELDAEIERSAKRPLLAAPDA